MLCYFITNLKNKEKFLYLKKKINNLYNLKNSRILFIINNCFEISKYTPVNNNKSNINIEINFDMKLNNMINEYFNHKDINESLIYIDDLITSNDMFLYEFIYTSINYLDDDNITIFNKLLINIFKKYNIMDYSFLFKIINELDDIVIDIPYAKKYVKKIIEFLHFNKILDNNLNKNLINSFK